MPSTGPIVPSKSAPTLTSGDALTRNWRVGQIMAATVASRSPSGEATLRIGTQQVQAQAGNINLYAGQRLELQVVALGHVPLLRLIKTDPPDPVRVALRNALPRQRPLSHLFSQLAQFLTRPGNASPMVLEMARNLIGRLPDYRQLGSTDGLRRTLRNSGLLLESRLASNSGAQADLTQDLKANLLRLIDALRNLAATITPTRARPGSRLSRSSPAAQSSASTLTTKSDSAPTQGILGGQVREPAGRVLLAAAGLQPLPSLDLVEHAESALARMRLNQLSSLNQDRPLSPEWLVELPVRRGEQIDTWQLHLRRDGTGEQGNNKPADGRWSAVLQFVLPNLGSMEVRVKLAGETVSTVFVAETKATVPVVEKHLPHLRCRLEALGLEVMHLGCHQGASSTPPFVTQRSGLLDEQV